MHPLKMVSLLSWISLLAFQLSLFWPASGFNRYLASCLVILLLIPSRGLLSSRVYTYKWIGFLTMAYFCLGISELMFNADLRVYGFGTTVSSMLLFMASIYYARYLKLQARKT
ncbi:MAG: DUF2069 domain-containing protein [Gammaproteobacteria bacterium]